MKKNKTFFLRMTGQGWIVGYERERIHNPKIWIGTHFVSITKVLLHLLFGHSNESII
jgi:hypothetical protein